MPSITSEVSVSVRAFVMSELQLVRNSTLLFRRTAETMSVSSKAKTHAKDSLVRSADRRRVQTAPSDRGLGNQSSLSVRQAAPYFLSKYKALNEVMENSEWRAFY